MNLRKQVIYSIYQWDFAFTSHNPELCVSLNIFTPVYTFQLQYVCISVAYSVFVAFCLKVYLILFLVM